jgi:nucleotide-binding universal stress UspA family protein
MFSMRLILSPIDFSNFSVSALAVARDLAAKYGSELLLVHVVPFIPKLPAGASPFSSADYENELIESAKRQLKDLAAEAQRSGLRARYIVGLANEPAMEILRIAEAEKADLILIATHGMSGWRRLAFGSVTEKVVRTADCPVLVLREQPNVSKGSR